MVRSAIFIEPNQPLQIREYPTPSLESGAILAKVRLATICGSDLHTFLGRRGADAPSILGHEIVGEIVQMSAKTVEDINGETLSIGDRITWGLTTSCGDCEYCVERDLSQKCIHSFKYGHANSEARPHLNGGFAQHLYLRPGSAILRLPDNITDAEAAPINCALATIMQAVDRIQLKKGERALVQGAGMLGIYACAVLSKAGCSDIIVTDFNTKRLAMAEKFGATRTIALQEADLVALADELKVDIVIEVCGVPSCVAFGIDALQIGGRYILAGLVYPDANFTVDGAKIVRKMLTLHGIHNYQPKHLLQAVDFVSRYRLEFPFEELVSEYFSLDEINTAFAVAQSGQVIRVAIKPNS